MTLRTIFLIALAALILSTPVHAEAEIESHPYFLALVAAEHCDGHRATLIEELRLAQLISQETGRRVSAEDVRGALNQQRYRPNPTVCKQPRYVEALDIYHRVVNPKLQSPVLREPQEIG